MSRVFELGSKLLFGTLIALSFVSPSFAEDGVTPGPAQEARQKLYDRILQAKAQGIGISAYMAAFKAIEEQVKAGDAAEKISPRIESINAALNKQVDNAKILKTQKPLPPQGSQITGSDSTISPPTASKPGSPAAAEGGGSGDMIDKLKSKLGGKLDNIPDSIKERIMSDPSMMEKIKSKMTGGGGEPAK
ncbi:MAG TPA: hypothetical protein PKZ32_21735 [Candidatus Melainabacteria bacterium]|nr:hypothetical protein [Candidatus Melainabacteria bacterium]